jgi:hypothetical protein
LQLGSRWSGCWAQLRTASERRRYLLREIEAGAQHVVEKGETA